MLPMAAMLRIRFISPTGVGLQASGKIAAQSFTSQKLCGFLLFAGQVRS
jgi:hypothetical protein